MLAVSGKAKAKRRSVAVRRVSESSLNFGCLGFCSRQTLDCLISLWWWERKESREHDDLDRCQLNTDFFGSFCWLFLKHKDIFWRNMASRAWLFGWRKAQSRVRRLWQSALDQGTIRAHMRKADLMSAVKATYGYARIVVSTEQGTMPREMSTMRTSVSWSQVISTW